MIVMLVQSNDSFNNITVCSRLKNALTELVKINGEYLEQDGRRHKNHLLKPEVIDLHILCFPINHVNMEFT